MPSPSSAWAAACRAEPNCPRVSGGVPAEARDTLRDIPPDRWDTTALPDAPYRANLLDDVSGFVPPPFLANIFAGPMVSATEAATSKLVRISTSALRMLCALVSARQRASGGGRHVLGIKDKIHHQLWPSRRKAAASQTDRHRARQAQAHKGEDKPFMPEQGEDGVVRSKTRGAMLPVGRLGGIGWVHAGSGFAQRVPVYWRRHSFNVFATNPICSG